MATIRQKITQTAVEKAEPAAARYAIHDTAIPGFRLIVAPSGRKSFTFWYRVGGGRGAAQREPKIGEHPAMKAERARAIAADWYAEVRKGGDPGGARAEARTAPRMSELFDRYLAEHARPKKRASSLEEDERLIRDFLLPAFGKRKVADLDTADVARFHAALEHKPYRANRSVALLSKAMSLAELWKLRPLNSNPCRHVARFAETKRERFLSPAELARLGDVLRIAARDGCLTLPPKDGARDKAERVPVHPTAVAAVRLLILTGARKSEVLGLQWAMVDMEAGRARLPTSKTGAKSIVLPPAALAVLAALPRPDGNPFVLAGARPGAAFVNLKDPWLAIREAAGLDDVRLHDLRHSFASIGAAGGESLIVIGKLLGHAQATTTARYAHLADDPAQAAARKIADRITAAMGDAGDAGAVVALRR